MPASTLILGRCNPYGAETGGPARVLGGLYGPRSATTPGLGLPANVAQGEWTCPQPAVVRCRMVCRHGHQGQVMQLCSWHDEDNYTSAIEQGRTRQVKSTVRQRGHYEEIQRRQAGACPRCLFPGDYAALAREVQQAQTALSQYRDLGLWRHPEAVALRSRIEDIGARMDEANARGIIHRCELTLVAVS